MATTEAERTEPLKLARFSVPSFIGVLYLLSWLPANGALQIVVYLGLPTLVILGALIGGLTFSRVRLALFGAWAAVIGLSLVLEGSNLLGLNATVALLTHASLLLLVVHFHFEPVKYVKLIGLLALLTTMETGIALTQFIGASGSLTFSSMSAGDAAVGTLLTNSHLFVVKMLAMSVVLGVAAAYRIRFWFATFGAFSALLGVFLGSALLATALAVVTIVAVILFFPTKIIPRAFVPAVRSLRRLVVVGTMTLVVGMAYLQKGNFEYVQTTLMRAGDILSAREVKDNSGKIVGARLSSELMASDAKVLMLGTGLGHYSSRAALILSGGYLASQPSWMPVSASRYTKDNILPLWNATVWSEQFRDGVMNQPFFGLQSFALEGGAIGLAILLLTYAYVGIALLNTSVQDRYGTAILTTGVIMYVLLPALLLTDNWLEFPHAAIALLLPISMALSLSKRPRAQHRWFNR